jgi:peptidoglycan/LPS O-acetylase OafA/YrhL
MKKLPSLNGLRAVSIIIVILFHLSRFNFYFDQETVLRIPIFNGRFGVNVFFVISGFLISSLLLDEERKLGSISVRDFYIRRVLRIFPAYFFLLGVYYILQRTGYIAVPKGAWITALTYTKYFNYHADFYTSHAWSLSIEEHFYLLWPLFFLLGNETRKNAAFFLVLAVPVMRCYIFNFPVSWIDEQSLFIRIDSIAMGCLFALYKDNILARLSKHWNRYFYGSLCLLFLVPWIERAVEGSYAELVFVAFGVLTGTIANVLIAIILAYSVYGPRGLWYKALNSWILNYIGVLSYSLYLWQQLFVAKNGWWVTHFPQNIGCIFLAAIFSHYLIERPFFRLKSRFAPANKKAVGYSSSPANRSGLLSRVRVKD